MGKFKVKFKIQGLELEVEGERDEIPQVTSAIQHQLGNLLSAPKAITGTDVTLMSPAAPAPEAVANASRKRANRGRSSAPSDKGAVTPLDFRHDPQKYGNPDQSWKTLQKSIWLLFVSEQQASTSEMSGGIIAATFNKHFRQAGEIKVGNVNRDLGVAKGKNPALLGEDTTKQPPAWYLTAAGKTAAQKLIEQVKSAAGSAS